MIGSGPAGMAAAQDLPSSGLQSRKVRACLPSQLLLLLLLRTACTHVCRGGRGRWTLILDTKEGSYLDDASHRI